MPDEDAVKAARRPDDVIAAVLSDHAEIKALFAEVQSAAAGNIKQDAFQRLVNKLAVHETAEEEVVHPLARRAGADATVDTLLGQESEGKDALSELEKLGVEAPDFDARLEKLRDEVLEHAETEEREEHPKIDQAVGEDELRQLAGAFRAAEATAPTHPHPHGPESATGNLVVGPVVSIMDRARDAIRSAMGKSKG